VDRFWLLVEVRGESDCWEWTGAKSVVYPGFAYGSFPTGRRGGHCYAHRHAWLLSNGPIPPGMSICHHCDNPPCCNPAHLFLGTQRDNIQDAVSKGRMRGSPGRHTPHYRPPPSYVARIREAYRNYTWGLGSRLARELGLSASAVCAIASGISYPKGLS
jgi:hypothetical protein